MTRPRLVDHRHEAGLTQEQVADRIGVDIRTYRSYEEGRITPRQQRRTELAKVLSLSGAELTLALSTDEDRGISAHGVPSWLGHLASLEQAAGAIATWEPFAIPGLLQTAGYACAIEAHGPDPISDEEVARKVENRLARQGVLETADFHLCAIVDESVLRRTAGSRSTMATQLDHLAEMAAHRAVDLMVVPLDAGVFSAAFGAFTLLWSPGSINPFMAITEDRAGPHYLDRSGELEAHVSLLTHLKESALSPDATLELIQVAAKEYR